MAEAHMHQIMSNLWIGDYLASQDADQLHQHKISHVVAAMRQDYPAPTGITVHRIRIDDTATTNIIEHFVPVANIIAQARLRSHGVLVHCQAGVSRSSALVAAYLMKEMDLTAEQALAKVRKARAQVEPSDFFMLQLELFERSNCEWNPVKYPEERRFLMSFAQNHIMGGTSPSLVLAYYPSPSPSPRDSSPTDPLKMTPLPSTSSNASITSSTHMASSSSPRSDSSPASAEPENLPAPFPLEPTPAARKRLTPRNPQREAERQAAVTKKAEQISSIEKIGTKAEVVVTGRRIRCKMCRRELAAREHILLHEPGKGQQAFAPHRRDMAAHRAEMEARRRDEIDREQQEEQQRSRVSQNSVKGAAVKEEVPSAALARLRIARPLPAKGIPGLRVAVPRPRPVVRPLVVPTSSSEPTELVQPHPIDGSSSNDSSPARIETEPSSTPEDYASSTPVPTSDPPILPSHLCSSYFTEPLSWMSPTLESGALEGKIVCPNAKCGAKLGSFDWAGAQCSCGAWICPGFALNVSRVDEITER